MSDGRDKSLSRVSDALWLSDSAVPTWRRVPMPRKCINKRCVSLIAQQNIYLNDSHLIMPKETSYLLNYDRIQKLT